jgi:hypothetical protein
VKVHQSGYQARDYEVVDYNLEPLPNTELLVRGPIPNLVKPYFTVIGAAQTFGCFSEKPYPTLLSEELGIPCLNLGFGGVGPEFFLKQDALIKLVNNSQFCIVQIMSGRSVSNSKIISLGSEYGFDRSDGIRKSTHKIYQHHISSTYQFYNTRLGRKMERAMARIASLLDREGFSDRLVDETRERWVNDYIQLSYSINVPSILFWFSVRDPDYRMKRTHHDALFGSFPQLVNKQMIDSIKQYYGPYVECITSEGLPQQLVNRFTGKEAICKRENDRQELAGTEFSTNYYYPSPEMHASAFDALTMVFNRWRSYLL